MKSLLLHLLSAAMLALLWQTAALIVKNPIIFPSFTETLARLFSLCSQRQFWIGAGFSFLRVFLGFFLIFFFGSAAGILSGIFPSFKTFLSFPLAVIRSVPVVSFILLAIFAFNSNFVPVFSAFLMGFPVMTSSVSAAFDFSDEDKKLFFMAKIFGLTKSQKIRFIFLPKFKPFLENGIFSSLGMSWKVVAAAEVLSVPKNALGSFLQNAQVHLETSSVLSATIVLVLISFLSEKILKFAFQKSYGKITSLKRPEFSSLSGGFPSGRGFRHCAAAPAASLAALSPVAACGVATVPSPLQVSIKNLLIVKGKKQLFKNFSIDFQAGKTTAILAPSGSGKTTLLNWIASQFNVSFLFQEPRLLPTLTVFENVFLPLKNILPENNAKNLALKYLKEAGLLSRLNDKTQNLSGGEKQRTAMARAFAFPKPVLLLDEAFQSLDEKIKKSLEETLKSLLKENPRTVIFVTHQKEEALSLADKIIEMEGEPLKIKKFSAIL